MHAKAEVTIGTGPGAVTFGNRLPLAIMAGPCAMESRDHALTMAAALVEITRKLGIGLAIGAVILPILSGDIGAVFASTYVITYLFDIALLVALVHPGVRKAHVAAPGEGPSGAAKLEALHLVRSIQPDNQFQPVILKPPPPVAGFLPDVAVFPEHGQRMAGDILNSS